MGRSALHLRADIFGCISDVSIDVLNLGAWVQHSILGYMTRIGIYRTFTQIMQNSNTYRTDRLLWDFCVLSNRCNILPERHPQGDSVPKVQENREGCLP